MASEPQGTSPHDPQARYHPLDDEGFRGLSRGLLLPTVEVVVAASVSVQRSATTIDVGVRGHVIVQQALPIEGESRGDLGLVELFK